MRHTYRAGFQSTGKKLIQVSDVAIDPWNHGNQGCVNRGPCFEYLVNPKDAYFLHYRNGWKVNNQCKDGKCVINDPVVLKYKTRLEVAMKNILAQIFQ